MFKASNINEEGILKKIKFIPGRDKIKKLTPHSVLVNNLKR